MAEFTHIVYHSGCLDGFTSAWMLHHAFPKAELIPAQYGDDIPDVSSEARVVIADFSFQRDQMISLAESADHVLVLDHHKTAQNNLVDLPDNVEVVFDMERSGAGIVLDWLVPNGYTPPTGAYELVPYIQDYDLWRKELPFTEEINSYCGSLPMTMPNWELLGSDMVYKKAQVIDTGSALVRYRNKLIDIIESTAREMNIAGHDVLVAAAPYPLGSLLGERLCTGENEDRPFGAYYIHHPWGTQFGLRSRNGFSVREVAEQFGGGGHEAAAGFKIEGEWDFETRGVQPRV